jgi:hypothetical protein
MLICNLGLVQCIRKRWNVENKWYVPGVFEQSITWSALPNPSSARTL